MGGSTPLPTANTPGYGAITRNGRTYVGCDCVIAFIKAGERVGLAAGKLKEGLDIVQLTGNASASGGTHRLGAAFDVKQYDSWWTVVWRNMGASFWQRLDEHPDKPGDLWDNNEHGHGGIDCPHNSLIAYQNVAYRRGYDGLGQGWYGGQYLWGYGHKDSSYRPPTFRSWREGIAWANAEAARLEKQAAAVKAAAASKPQPAPALAPVGDDMPAPKDLWNWDGVPAPKANLAADPKNTHWTPSSYLYYTYASLADMRAQVADLTAQVKALTDALNNKS